MRKFALAPLVAAVAFATAFAADSKDYGWRFTKGEKLRYAYVYNVQQSFVIMGMPQNVRQDARLELTEEAIEASDASATIQATIDRLFVEAEVPAMMGQGGGKITFDSAKKADEPKKDDKKKKSDDDDDEDEGPGAGGMNKAKAVLEGLRVIVGEKFTYKIAKDGSISELKGVEELAKKVNEKLGGQPGAFPLLEPEVLQETLDLHCHVFATGEAGDSWKIPTKVILPNMGQLSFTRTITPKGDKLSQVGSKPEVTEVKKGAGASNPMMAMLGKPTVKDSSFSGESTFSKEKGKIVADELTATLENEYSMDNPMGGKGKKKPADDDDDDDDAPKKKDEKKSEKKGDDEGGQKIQFTQNFKLVMRYELLTGEAEKSPEKKDKDF